MKSRCANKRKKDIVLIEAFPGNKMKNYIERGGALYESGSSVSMREPIAIEYIAAFLESKGLKTKVIQQNNISDQELVKQVLDSDPGFIGLSVLTYVYPHNLDLIRKLKESRLDAKIIMGGYHPTGDSAGALKSGLVDFVVAGEGEVTLLNLIETLRTGEDIQKVNGIGFMDKEDPIITPSRGRMNFAELPWPKRNLEILRYCKAVPLAYPAPPDQIAAAQISYSRGCLGGCNFCPSQTMWGKTLSFRDPKDVVSEIRYLQETFGTNFLFFNDLSFSLGSENESIRLCEEIIQSRLRINWFAMANTNISTNLAEKMAEAGCTRIGFGVEAVTPSGIRETKPHQNLDKTKRALELTSGLGILNRAYLMLGTPSETRETLSETLRIVKALPIDQIRFGFLVPFLGTKDNARWGNTIKLPYEKWTGDEPVMPSRKLNIEELIEIRDKMISEFYSSDDYWRRATEKTSRFPHLKTSYDYLYDFLKTKGVIK